MREPGRNDMVDLSLPWWAVIGKVWVSCVYVLQRFRLSFAMSGAGLRFRWSAGITLGLTPIGGARTDGGRCGSGRARLRDVAGWML